MALHDADSRVCEAAAFALEEIGTGARDSLGALADAVREQASETCKMIDVTAATQESQMDLGWTVRWASARALGAINGEPSRTVDALQAALTDSMWQVRGVAALSLGRVRSPLSVKALVGALTDEVGAVRKAAAISLGELGRDARDALPALHAVANDEDQAVREAGLAAIDRIIAR
jgi:HEAT repeat protein